MSDDLPDIFIGNAQTPLESVVPLTPDTDPDPDDELLAETPEDVVAALGFDPLYADDDELDHVPADLAAEVGMDDANWKESDHPRGQPGNAGQFGSGGGGAKQAAAKATPHPALYLGKAGLLVKGLAAKGLHEGTDPSHVADQIKELVATYKHPTLATYANSALAHMEQAHGLKPGTLGKAKVKGQLAGAAPPKASKPAAPPPPPKPAAPPPQYPPSAAYSSQAALEQAQIINKVPKPPGAEPTANLYNIYGTAIGSTQTIADKITAIANIAQETKLNSEEANYAEDVIAALEQHQAPAAAPEAVKGPEPNQNSQHQKNVHDIATGAGTNAEKVAKIKAYPTVTAYPEGYTAKFAKEWVEALGGKMDAPAQPAPAAPKPPATPKVSAATLNAVAHTDKDVLDWATKMFDGAEKPASAHSAGAKAIAPTLDKGWWSGVPGAAVSAVHSYVGAGSTAMNNVLRGYIDPEDSESVHKIKAMHKLYARPEAKLTQDVVLRRGVNVWDPKLVPGWKKALAAGIPAIYTAEGFVSSSMANQAAFNKELIFEMTCRAGVRALGVDAISPHNENELLLAHGQQFEVYEIHNEGHRTIVRMVSGHALED